MISLRPILSFLFCFSLSLCAAQTKKYDISAPLDAPVSGIYKVLSMKNGNTMLFHFESKKPITVKIFDSTHKEIASKDNPCRLLDIYIIKDAIFKGLFEVNGEAVLFMEQDHLSKNGLVRLRFNATDGTMIDEKLVRESKSMTKSTAFFVMNNKNEGTYAILYATEIPQFKDCDVNVTYYNAKHEETKVVPLNVDRKKYDFLTVINAEWQPNGISISLGLEKETENATSSIVYGSTGTNAVYDHYLTMYYIPADSSKALAKTTNLSANVYPFYANYTYNAFANTLNLLLFGYREMRIQNGLEWLPGATMQHLFLKFDQNTLDVNYKWLNQTYASNVLKKKDTAAVYEGFPVDMYTNENGLSTVVSQTLSLFRDTRSMRNNYTFLGNIGITQFGDDGEEIWGTVLPLSQCYRRHAGHYSAYEVSKKWQNLLILTGLPNDVYDRQFVSVKSGTHNKDLYVLFNDNNKNFNSTVYAPGDTVYNYNNVNTCYYKISKRNEVSRHYLYGDPADKEYMAGFIEGADFNEKTGVYASLVQYKKGEDITLHMAWSHLE